MNSIKKFISEDFKNNLKICGQTYSRKYDVLVFQNLSSICQTIYKKFDPQGVTVLCLLSESHISIHTWPEEHKASADIFTCGLANPKIGCDVIIEQLRPIEYKLNYIQR